MSLNDILTHPVVQAVGIVLWVLMFAALAGLIGGVLEIFRRRRNKRKGLDPFHRQWRTWLVAAVIAGGLGVFFYYFI